MTNDAPPDSGTGQQPATKPNSISRSALQHSSSIITIGLIAAKALLDRSLAVLMVNRAGEVEFVPPGELELDALPEPSALSALIGRGYTDQQLSDYLRQREDRRLNELAQSSPEEVIANG